LQFDVILCERDTRPRLGIATWPPTLVMMAPKVLRLRVDLLLASSLKVGVRPMRLSKSRLVASGFAIAGLGAVALGYAAPHLGGTWLSNADRKAFAQTAPADPSPIAVADTRNDSVRVAAPGTQVETGRDVRVDAPHTAVRVNKDSGKVAVRAPHTAVKVDPDKGQVRVRAPYVNLDIRW
jgi:hypothetical protein